MTRAERDTLRLLITEAQQTLKEYKENMDDWSYAEYDGHKHTWEELAPDLVAAIKKAKTLL